MASHNWIVHSTYPHNYECYVSERSLTLFELKGELPLYEGV